MRGFPRPARELLLPAGIVVLSAAWVSLYAFSSLGAHSHMETSFGRIMLAPSMVGLIYALESFALGTGAPEDAA